MISRLSFVLLGALSLSAFAAEEGPVPLKPAPGPGAFHYVETARFPAAEADQGVASDGEFIYAINNREIGKYRKDTHAKVAAWRDAEDGFLIHMNAGILYQGRLYCAHSNYPNVPMLSSVEIFDPVTMQHVGSHSFGHAEGSFTWLDRRGDHWIACFVHYGKKGGEPGKGPEWTQLVEFDNDWRRIGGWALPPELIAHIGEKGYSCSGGSFGPGGYLYVTGHDAKEVFVLTFPEGGSILKWKATIPVPASGQAFGWDPRDVGTLYMIQRKDTVIVGKVTIDEAGK